MKKMYKILIILSIVLLGSKSLYSQSGGVKRLKVIEISASGGSLIYKCQEIVEDTLILHSSDFLEEELEPRPLLYRWKDKGSDIVVVSEAHRMPENLENFELIREGQIYNFFLMPLPSGQLLMGKLQALNFDMTELLWKNSDDFDLFPRYSFNVIGCYIRK